MEKKAGRPATVDEYIAQFPEDLQQILTSIRAAVKEAVPEAEEKISYNMPGFFLNGGLLWFSANKRHIGIYPKTAGMLESIPELSTFKGTKGSLHIPLDKPVPYDLIRKIVKVRAAENLEMQAPF